MNSDILKKSIQLNNEKTLENVVRNITVARVDFLFNNMTGKEVKVISCSKGASVNKPDWFQELGVGYVLESDGSCSYIEFVCGSDCEITVRMRSKDIRDENDKNRRVLYYIDYTFFSVNNRVLSEDRKVADHNKFILYTINAKAGEKVRFDVEWDVHLEGQDILNISGLPGSLKEEMYDVGRGKDENTGLSAFESFCRQAVAGHDFMMKKTDPDVYEKKIHDFFERNSISYDPGYDWYDWMSERSENNLIDRAVKKWHVLSDEDKGKGIEILFKYWKDDKKHVRIIYSMTGIMKDNKDALADAFAYHLISNKKRRKTPKVIGTYYHIYGNGGIQRVISKLMQLWMKMGYKVVLITDTEISDDDYDLPEGVIRVRLDEQTDENRRGKCLTDLIRKYKIDTMVYHDYMNDYLLHDLLICKCLDVSFVLYYHSIFIKYLLLNDRRMYLIPHIAKCADLMVVLSELNKKYWEHFNGDVHVVMNPLVFDLENAAEAPKDSKNIIWVGRLDEHKRFEEPVYIMERLIKKHSDARLTVVGSDSSGKFFDILKDKVDALSLQDNITLCGYQKDVGPFYEDASVFLMTSTHEGYPMALLEALSYGLPVVMYDLPYLTMVRDNPGIISVKQGDTDKAAEVLGELLDDEGRKKELGSKSRKFVEELYSNNKVERQWRDIFDSLVSIEYRKPEDDEVLSTILDALRARL